MGKRVLFWLSVWLLAMSVSAADPQSPQEPPPKPSAAVQKLLDEADQLTKAKQPQAALQAADQALATARKVEDSVGEAQAHRSRALALQSLDRTEEAVAAWREAATTWERAGDGPGRIEALASVGLLLPAGKSAEADSLVAQALALGRAESKRPLAAATVLDEIGIRYADRGLLRQGLELFEAGLSIREKLAPESLDVAKSLNNLGRHVLKQGDLVAAEKYQCRALAIGERLAPNSLQVAVSLNTLGLVVEAQGDLTNAGEYYQRALAIRDRLAPNSLDAANSLVNLGNLAFLQGDLVAGGEYHRRALAIRETLAPNSLSATRSLANLGSLAFGQGDFEAAEGYLRRALVIFEERVPNSLDVAKSLHNLGGIATQQGNLLAAEGYYERAQALFEKLAPHSLLVASNLDNRGSVAVRRGDLTTAGEYFRRSLAIQQKLAPHSLGPSVTLASLGNLALLQGDLVAAEEYLRQALAIRERLAPNTVAFDLNYLGKIARKQGNLVEAERWARRAWELIRSKAAGVTGDEARQAFGKQNAFYAANLVRYQLALGKAGEAFITLEEGRAQALQQLLLERNIIKRTTDEKLWPEYQSAVTARDRAGHALSKASVTEADARKELDTRRKEGATPDVLAQLQATYEVAAKKLEESQSNYTRTRVEADAFWAKIKEKSPRLFVPPLTLEQAQKTLQAGTLLVAFSVNEEQTHIFLLRAENDSEMPLSVHTIDVPDKELKALVYTFRAQITDRKDSARLVASSRALFAKLFPTEARAAIQNAKRLLISPDGPLWEVPFAALVINAQRSPKYLSEDRTITYAQSLALYAQSRNQAPALAKGTKPSAVIVGDPIFDRTAQDQGTKFALRDSKPGGERSYFFTEGKPPVALPATRTEAIKISRLYDSEPLTGEQATEAALRQRLETADVIHLATHGYWHPVRAMSSGLLLTVPDRNPEIGETDNDGILQAWEIYSQLKLKAELVVLSACETGRGQTVLGEGLVGMTRAFQYAGASSIIASQWKADDQSTLTLMVALHRKLRDGLPKDEALRQAMAVVRREKSTAHPYYWAPFFLMGDPDNSNLGVETKRPSARRESLQ